MNLAKITQYPGGDLIAKGVDDYAAGHRAVPACLVAIAASTLRQIGLPISTSPAHIIQEPEHELLRQESGDAYSQYNAFLRQLTSFIRAAHALEN